MAKLIETAGGALIAEVAVGAPDRTVVSPMGPMDIDTLLSYSIAHLGMHGCAVARAFHRPYPIGPSEVELVLPFLVKSMPRILDRQAVHGLKACFEIRLRGGSRMAFMFDDGQVTIAPKPFRRVDCYLSAEPLAFFLVGMGLVSQYKLIAQGKLMTFGTKPWLALKFGGYFRVP